MLPAAAKTGSSVSSEEPSTGSGLEYKLIGGVNEIFRRSIVKADAILDSAVKLLKKYNEFQFAIGTNLADIICSAFRLETIITNYT